MNTTTLERPVDAASVEAAPSEQTDATTPARRLLGYVLLAVSVIGLLVALAGAVVSSAAIVLVSGVVAMAAGVAYGFFAPVYTYGQ